MKQWWIGLARRERLGVLTAGLIVAAALVYLLGIEPAWRTRARLTSDLPRLRAETVELDALAAEASKLKGRTRTPESPADTKAVLGRLLAERHIAVSTIREDEARLIVSARRADVAAWLAWLAEASSELPLRVSSARLSRVAPGVVDAEVTLVPVGQK
jgi:general secretion pathway protein M